MAEYTRPIPLEKLPSTPSVLGEMLEEYNNTKKQVSREITVEGLGKGRLVMSQQNKFKPFFYADEANVAANQKAVKQTETLFTLANAPALLAPLFGIVTGGKAIMNQRLGNQIKKMSMSAKESDLSNAVNVLNNVVSRTKNPTQITSKASTSTPVKVNPYTVTSKTQRDILSQINTKIKSTTPITITSTGNVPVVLAKKDDDINKLYKESQDPKDPNELENLLQQQAGTKGEAGSRIDIRSQYGYDVLANTPSKNIDLLAELGLTTNDSIFLLANYQKSDISRDASAAIQSLFTTVDEFNDVKDKALPFFLKAMKGVKRKKTPELDHVAQLKSSLPFFNNAKVSQFPEIAKIVVEEGVFGLGHQRSNFKYLEFDVHTVKSRFFKNKVGANGEKFFLNRDISTPAKLRAAAREYAKIIDDSNNVVADAIEQYKFMNKTEISEQELEDFVNILGNQPIRRKYSIKQVRDIFKQMEEDGFIQTAKESKKIEDTQIKAEQKEAERQNKLSQQLEKDRLSVEDRRKQMEKFLNENLNTFNVNPYPLGMRDEGLRELAEDAYRLFREQRLAIEGSIQTTLFDAEDRERFIKLMMRSILNRIKRDIQR